MVVKEDSESAEQYCPKRKGKERKGGSPPLRSLVRSVRGYQDKWGGNNKLGEQISKTPTSKVHKFMGTKYESSAHLGTKPRSKRTIAGDSSENYSGFESEFCGEFPPPAARGKLQQLFFKPLEQVFLSASSFVPGSSFQRNSLTTTLSSIRLQPLRVCVLCVVNLLGLLPSSYILVN